MTTVPPEGPGPPSELTPVPVLPPAVVERYHARVLDPVSAVPTVGAAPPRPTAYVGDTLLVRGLAGDDRDGLLDRIGSVLQDDGLAVRIDPAVNEVATALAGSSDQGQDVLRRFWVNRAELFAADESDRRPIDAWPVLQRLRGAGVPAQEMGLDHLVLTCPDIGGTPYWEMSAGGYPLPAQEYVRSGSGGRCPVAFVGSDPARASRRIKRRPVVVVPDTGLGPHPWFADPASATDEVTVAGVLLGIHGPMNPLPPIVRNPLDGSLPTYAGHGTFIAGVVRQQCPQARILGVPVMGGDGVVPEDLLINTLVALLVRQVEAVTEHRAADLLDVLSLSLGYYHEEPADPAMDPMLHGLLTELGRWGVAVVTAAGNNTTTVPFHPAAFAGQVTGTEPDVVPLVSVGALNPDGTSVAYFSNAGPWVSCHRPGAAVVSTLPTDLDGDLQPTARMRHDRTDRATIDPDDFTGGFGTWSGTSFAAPVLSGQLAAHLAADPTTPEVDQAIAVTRCWAAVTAELGWTP